MKNDFKKTEHSRESFIPIDINDDVNRRSGSAFEVGSRHPKWRGGTDKETKHNRSKTYNNFGIGFFPATGSSAGAAKYAQANKVKINRSPLRIGAPKFTLLDELHVMKREGELYRKRNARKKRKLRIIELKKSQALAKKLKKSSMDGNFIRGLDKLACRFKDK